jgi:hypothetical protein
MAGKVVNENGRSSCPTAGFGIGNTEISAIEGIYGFMNGDAGLLRFLLLGVASCCVFI